MEMLWAAVAILAATILATGFIEAIRWILTDTRNSNADDSHANR